MDNTLECEVIMLQDTNDRSQLGTYPCIVKKCEIIEGKIIPTDKLMFLKERTLSEMPYTGQHLYFVSTEGLKFGDWGIQGNSIYQYSNKGKDISDWNKIVATTNKTLGLPTIPEDILVEYVRIGVDKVWLKTLKRRNPNVTPKYNNDWIETIVEVVNNEVVIVKFEQTNKIIKEIPTDKEVTIEVIEGLPMQKITGEGYIPIWVDLNSPEKVVNKEIKNYETLLEEAFLEYSNKIGIYIDYVGYDCFIAGANWFSNNLKDIVLSSPEIVKNLTSLIDKTVSTEAIEFAEWIRDGEWSIDISDPKELYKIFKEQKK